MNLSDRSVNEPIRSFCQWTNQIVLSMNQSARSVSEWIRTLCQWTNQVVLSMSQSDRVIKEPSSVNNEQFAAGICNIASIVICLGIESNSAIIVKRKDIHFDIETVTIIIVMFCYHSIEPYITNIIKLRCYCYWSRGDPYHWLCIVYNIETSIGLCFVTLKLPSSSYIYLLLFC